MNNKFISTAAYLGALTIAFGAFGAHALKERLSPDAMAIFETAVRYQFYHVFALLATGIIYNSRPNKLTSVAGKLLIAGIIVFCGSLYILTYTTNSGNDGLRWIGAITPIGGVCFIAGWVCLGIAAAPKSPKGDL